MFLIKDCFFREIMIYFFAFPCKRCVVRVILCKQTTVRRGVVVSARYWEAPEALLWSAKRDGIWCIYMLISTLYFPLCRAKITLIKIVSLQRALLSRVIWRYLCLSHTISNRCLYIFVVCIILLFGNMKSKICLCSKLHSWATGSCGVRLLSSLFFLYLTLINTIL